MNVALTGFPEQGSRRYGSWPVRICSGVIVMLVTAKGFLKATDGDGYANPFVLDVVQEETRHALFLKKVACIFFGVADIHHFVPDVFLSLICAGKILAASLI